MGIRGITKIMNVWMELCNVEIDMKELVKVISSDLVIWKEWRIESVQREV